MTTNEDRQARIGRLKWHCRRALLELDLVFQRFWTRYESDLNLRDEKVLARLLDLEDHELWALVSARTEADDPELRDMVQRLRTV